MSTAQQQTDTPDIDADLTRLTHQLIDIACAQPTHLVALKALIQAYASVAACHPCCAHAAANTARLLVDVIDSHAAQQDARHIH